MATDYWSTEEGWIGSPFDGSIGFFEASAAVTEGKPVKLGTGASGVIKCQNATAVGDAIGIALKAASSGGMVPVCVYGVVKVLVDGQAPDGNGDITTGDFLVNSAIVVVAAHGGNTTSTATLTSLSKYKGICHQGSSYVLGMALQPSTVRNDEILMLVGKTL